jgi:hypothetical protein
MKSKIYEAKDWSSRRLKKSKIYEVEVLETQREYATRVESRGATNVGMPFGYPRISIPVPAYYKCGLT